MLKFIQRTILFLIVASVFYVVMVIIWTEIDYDSFIRKNIWYEMEEAGIGPSGNINSYGHMFSRMKEVKKVNNIDLLVIGSSQAYRGFDTRIFNEAGFKTFNLGSSNQTPLQSEVLLNRYIKQLHPKTIIYTVYPEVFSVDGAESTLDLLANDHPGFDMISLVLKQENLKLLNTMIYTGYRELFNLNDHFIEPAKTEKDTYIDGGYVERELSYYGHHTFEPSTWQFNHNQFMAFERTLKIIKKENIRLLLVQPPTPKPFDVSHTNNASFDSIMNCYGNYYNFNHLISLDDSLHFYDEFHLNQNGVALFDQKVIELLKWDKALH